MSMAATREPVFLKDYRPPTFLTGDRRGPAQGRVPCALSADVPACPSD